MKKKFQIKDIFGKVLFEYKSENNTIKKTLEEAVRQGRRLYHANLSGADLREANLKDAYLENAVLINANLENAILENANLRYADLADANLMNADLRNANLSKTFLSDTILVEANLENAYLRNAYLDCVYLQNASLRNVKLTEVFFNNVRNGKNIPFFPLNLPEGEFIAYKKVYTSHDTSKMPYIVKLKILADSKRSRATSHKCRCDKALVLEIQDIDGNKLDLTEITNFYYSHCTYKVGEIVYADGWDENRWEECTNGIHFFLDRQMAVDY